MILYDLNLSTFEITEIECDGLYGRKMYIKNGRRYSLRTMYNNIFTDRVMAVETGESIINMQMKQLQIKLEKLKR